MMKLFKTLLLLSLSLPLVEAAYAWGERGHDLLTRVAVKELRRISNDNAQLVTPFRARDHMLSHLSNVPDIVWRAPYMSEQDRSANYTTHYINLDRVYKGVVHWADFPLDMATFTKDAAAKELTPQDVGTAPWRVMQLYRQLVTELKSVASDSQDRVERVNEALLVAGVMAHFVGDLSNPHHTTVNYDGQLTGQRGLHAYFESDVIAELPLGLAALIEAQAQQEWLVVDSERKTSDVMNDPHKLVWALVANSHRDLSTLLALDRQHSLLAEDTGEQSQATRKPPKEVAPLYQQFAVKRLAIGASVLARLWWMAWEEAGRPDMSEYHSYVYPVMPDFIDPDYLTPSDQVKAASPWRELDPDNTLVMQLEGGTVVFELAPQFAPRHVENIKLLAKEGYFDGTAIIRSQDNYVAQWGDPHADTDKAKSIGSALPKIKVEFFRDPAEVGFQRIESRDAYADQVGFSSGFPTASDGKQAWLTHCYGMLGVARGMGDDSGNGSGLYVVTGHAPRHLDRNVTLVGRVVQGMQWLTTLPRGTGPLGFYESAEEQTIVRSIKLGSDVPELLPAIQIMRTDSADFQEHVAARTTRNEDWFLEPTGRIELCNVSVPTQKAQEEAQD